MEILQKQKPIEETKNSSVTKVGQLAVEAVRRFDEDERGNRLELEEFYNMIENPILDDSTLMSIVDAYSKRTDGFGGLYGSLQKVGIEEKETGLVNRLDRLNFEESMYGRWRSSMGSMTKQEYLEAYKQGVLGKDFRKLRNFVHQHPECKSEVELRSAIEQAHDKEESELLDAVDKYNWNLDNGWIHVKSRYVNMRQEERIDVGHRFYLNTDSTSTHAVANALVEAYEKAGLPYYFKYDEFGDRADNIVIYTSTKDLINNLNILRQLKVERPDLAEHFHTPPILTGKIDGDIGYGAEPEKGSYNEVRADILEKALKDITLRWVLAHQDQKVKYGGEKMSFSNYVTIKAIEELRTTLSKGFQWAIDGEKRAQGLTDERVAIDKVVQKKGYNQRDLEEGSKMFKYMQNKMNENFSDSVRFLLEGKNLDLKVKLRNGKSQNLAECLVIALERVAPLIASHDQNYLTKVRERVNELCVKRGIDADKFVFDNLTVVNMQRQSRIEKRDETLDKSPLV